MLRYLLCVILLVLIFVIAHQLILKKSNRENFSGGSSIGTSVDISSPDLDLMSQASIVSEAEAGLASSSGNSSSSNNSSSSGNTEESDDVNLDDYVLKSDIERAARASTRKYCPVSPDYNPANYIKKTEIDLETACPKLPDLKDYVLKSTIPPVQKCPSCICPKVKVSAGMCKECPKPRNNCPKCEPCGVEQCRDVIQCASNEKQVSCPKCPPPMPCPQPPEKVCPSFELPESNIKCPSPKPCPMPSACPDGKGRCPEAPESKCKYYGIKQVVKEKPVNDIVNELLLSDDPELKALLENLKSKLDINLTPSPNNIQNNINIPKQTTRQAPAPTTQPLAPTTQPLAPTTQQLAATTSTVVNTTSAIPQPSPTTNTLLPAATTQNARAFNPQANNQANHQYEFNTYGYSTLNNLNYMGTPQPTYNSNVENTALEGAANLGCDVNDSNCSYNTNLNI
jgi:hypothetical protein